MPIIAEYDVNIEVANVGNLAIAPGKITQNFGVATAGNFGVGTVVAESTELSISSTAATTLATFTPTADGSFIIVCYFTVSTGATTITLTYNWTDSSGVQSTTKINAISEAIGSYTVDPYTITAKTTGVISVTLTAGTANQVVASCSIIGL